MNDKTPMNTEKSLTGNTERSIADAAQAAPAIPHKSDAQRQDMAEESPGMIKPRTRKNKTKAAARISKRNIAAKKALLQKKLDTLLKEIEALKAQERAGKEECVKQLAFSMGIFALTGKNYEKYGIPILSDTDFEKSLKQKDRALLDEFKKNQDSEQLLDPEAAVDFINSQLAPGRLTKAGRQKILHPDGV